MDKKTHLRAVVVPYVYKLVTEVLYAPTRRDMVKRYYPILGEFLPRFAMMEPAQDEEIHRLWLLFCEEYTVAEAHEPGPGLSKEELIYRARRSVDEVVASGVRELAQSHLQQVVVKEAVRARLHTGPADLQRKGLFLAEGEKVYLPRPRSFAPGSAGEELCVAYTRDWLVCLIWVPKNILAGT